MLRMYQSRSAEGVKDYYTEALETGDYYLDAEYGSPWRGKLAERLGLGPEVVRETFARMADNLHPKDADQPLTPRTGDNRTVGYDLNFHVPKGVSVLHLWTRDARIIEAIRASVDETMREIERQAATRVRVGGQDTERHTGELVWGEFVHSTTRPVDGIPDPHLHVHCYVFNATYDAVEGRIKAGYFRDIKRDAPYHEAAFYSRLAARLEALGYGVERRGKQWDVAGMPRRLLQRFSRRTAQIEKAAARLGITDPERKSRIGAATRDAKSTARLLPSQLRSHWLDSIPPEERAALDQVPASRCERTRTAEEVREASDRAVAYAIQDRFERASVVSMPRLLETALRYGLQDVTPESVKQAAARHPELLAAREGTELLVTTREVLREERALVRFAREGRGMCVPLEGQMPWADRYAQGATPSALAGLNADQERAVGHVLTSRDRVILIRGGSGTGKTTLTRATAAELARRGVRVFGMAPSADASRGALREAGVKDAETVAAFLGSAEAQRSVRGGVIWVDEAGQLGSKSMRALMEVAERQNARLVLAGDTRQHGPVERGDALRLLESRAGIRSAEVTEIVRQRGTYKEAVAAIDAGRYDQGVAALDAMGAIRQVEAGDWSELARDYVHTVRTGRTCMAVAPTHAEGQGMTGLIRAELKRHGILAQDERLVERCRDLGWSEAQRGDAKNYEEGQVVQFHRATGRGKSGFRAGERLEVAGHDEKGQVRVRDRDGRERILPLGAASSFAVSERSLLNVAVGERLRMTGNGRTLDGEHRLNNGTVHRVAGFTPEGHVRLGNGWIVGKDFAAWEHGYVGTSHASQGRSADRVLVWQSWSGLPAGSVEQVYVSLSRGRESVAIYTEDREALVEALGQRGERRLGLELVDGVRPAAPVRARERPAITQEAKPHRGREGTRPQTASLDHPSRGNRMREHALGLARLRAYEATRQRMERAARARQQARERPERGRRP